MTRLLSTIIAGAFGWLVGLALMWGFDLNYAAIALAALFALAGWIAGEPTGISFGRNDTKVLKQAIDMALVLAWASAPAMARFSRNQDRYLQYEENLLNSCIPLGIREKMYNYEDFIGLFRESLRTRSEPFASLKRHNRAFRPGIFKKESASYTVLQELARVTIAAGADRRGAVWYYHVASKLHVSPKHAAGFMETAIAEQLSSPLMIPGFPDHDSPIATASEGITIKKDLEPYLDAYDKGRSRILDMMFGDDSRAA